MLVIAPAELIIRLNYAEYASSASVAESLILPGCEEPIEIISSPELSPDGSHLIGHFIDITHSGTRLRANCTSRDAIVWSRDIYLFIAREGFTPLKETHMEYRVDMMSDEICRVSQ